MNWQKRLADNLPQIFLSHNSRIIMLAIAVLMLMLSSCAQSFQPFYSENDLIEDPDLIGTWIDEDQKIWIFEKGEDANSYDLSQPITEKISAGLTAHLARLGGYTYLDLYPKEPKRSDFRNNLYKIHFLPVHTISQIQIEKNSLSVSMLDGQWLMRLEESGKLKIDHVRIDDFVVLSASTAELQKFIIENAENRSAFMKRVKLTRKQSDKAQITASTPTKNSIDNPTASTSPTASIKPAEAVTPFDFHNGFWINLHHFLYQQALYRRQYMIRKDPPAAQRPASLERLTPAQREVWNRALDYYTESIIKQDLLFNEEMVKIKDRLEDLEYATDLKNGNLNPELTKQLEQAAPIYRAIWWPEHERANQSWIAMITPLVSRFDKLLIKQLEQAYQTKWPGQPIRVDVTNYANWTGAYTSVNPGRITISGGDKRNEDFAALEILFHEASHIVIDKVIDTIADEYQSLQKPAVKDLWHAVLFYTTGEIVKRTLASNGIENYQPYAYKNGLYNRAPDWQLYQKALERYWQPYLDGKTEFKVAIKQLVNALVNP